jgi:hypothetical protein
VQPVGKGIQHNGSQNRRARNLRCGGESGGFPRLYRGGL